MSARAWVAPIVAGGIVAIVALGFFARAQFPVALVRPFAVEVEHPIDLHGGMRGVFGLSGEAATPAARSRVIKGVRERIGPDAGGDVRIEGAKLIVDLPGTTRAPSAGLMSPGRFEIRLVEDDTDFMRALARHAANDWSAHAAGIEGAPDAWHDADGGAREDVYLRADDRDSLVTYLHNLEPRFWPDAEHELLIETIERRDLDRSRPLLSFRTYYAQRAPVLDRSMVAGAEVTSDPTTNRPAVRVVLTAAGSRRLADATRRWTGRKTALLVDGDVVSAPVVAGPITGGRLTFTLGSEHHFSAEEETRAFVGALRRGPLPPGIAEGAWTQVWPKIDRDVLLLVQALYALLGGAITFGALWLGRRARVPWVRRPLDASGSGTPPLLRLLVTLAAPAAILLLERIGLPGVDRTLLGDAGPMVHLGMLGVTPILVAFVLVEIVAAIVPPLRRLRARPDGRARLSEAVAAAALVLAAFQGWTVARWLESSNLGIEPGFRFEALVTLTLVAATFLFVALAWLAGRHGLVSGWSIVLLTPLVGAARQVVRELDAGTFTMAAAAYGVVLCGAAALITIWIARRTIAPLRLPAAGLVPLAISSAIPALASLLATLGLPIDVRDLGPLVPGGASVARFAILIASSVLLTWLFARRAAPTPRVLAQAAVASTAYVIAIELLRLVAARTGALPLDLALAATAGAVALDAVCEWRARRATSDLVEIWPLHDVHDVDRALAALAAAGIPAHARAAHHRALLHFFGPFVPISILVPAARAREGREVLEHHVSGRGSS